MDCILGMDIGGTNTSIGVFDMKFKQILIFENKTKDKHPYNALKDATAKLKKKGWDILAAGFAVAGPVKGGSVHLTHAGLTLSLKKFRSILKTKHAIMLNDFEAVAYSLNAIEKNDIIALTKNRPKGNSVKVVLGAGTGLGKAVSYIDKKTKFHTPLSAEEGHSAIAIMSDTEFSLMQFIKKRKKANVVWEDVLSGRGIATVYEFIIKEKLAESSVETTDEVMHSIDKASAISKHREKDAACKKTFGIFSTFYARFIRNSMLQSLPYGGVYIAGGIAIRNPDILQSKEFKRELHQKSVYGGIIRKIPIFLFSSTTIGLKGAAFAAKNMRV